MSPATALIQTAERVREAHGVQDREDPAEGVVRRDSVEQIEKRLQPCLLGLAEFLNGDEGVRATNHGDQRQDQDTRERMQPRSIDLWISNLGEVLKNRRCRQFVARGVASMSTHGGRKDHARAWSSCNSIPHSCDRYDPTFHAMALPEGPTIGSTIPSSTSLARRLSQRS
jgi:hypothetical protein